MSPESTPRVGVWGAGVAAGAYAAACRSLGWRVACITSHRPERATDLAAAVDALAVTRDAFVRSTELDLVIICTPPADHADALDALADSSSIRVVVVTAPMVTTLDDVDRIAGRRAPTTMFGWPMVTAPVIQELMRRVGGVGPITDVALRTSRPAPTWGDYTSGEWGGGALQFAGTEQIALALLVGRVLGLGRPRMVTATLSGLDTGRADSSADASVVFEHGVTARIHADWVAHQPTWELQVAGSDGVLRVDLFPRPVLEQNGEPVAIPAGPSGDEQTRALQQSGIVGMLRSCWDTASTGRAPAAALSVGFGGDVAEVVAAAYVSAGRGGLPIPLPFTGPRHLSPLALFAAATAPD